MARPKSPALIRALAMVAEGSTHAAAARATGLHRSTVVRTINPPIKQKCPCCGKTVTKYNYNRIIDETLRAKTNMTTKGVCSTGGLEPIPIASAPTDGTWVLLFVTFFGEHYIKARKLSPHNKWIDAYGEVVDMDEGPTHWIPYPHLPRI